MKLKYFLFIAIFLFLFFINPSKTLAVAISSCSFDPRSLNTTEQAHVKLVAGTGGFAENFILRIRRTSSPSQTITQTQFSLNPGDTFETNVGPFDAGNYESSAVRSTDSSSLSCITTFRVIDSSNPSSDPLYRSTEPATLTSSTPIQLNFEVNAGTNLISYIVSVDGRPEAPAHLNRVSDNKAQATVGPLPDGHYLARLQKETLSGPQLIGTPIPITVGTTNNGSSGCGSNCTKSAGIPCDPKDGQAVEGGIMTAIGCIPTDPQTLIAKLISFATGIGGGIALLLMIMGAFQMMTNGSNPDGIKKGREQFIAAAIGLVFIIFSVTILQILGVDILKIPGFGK